MDHYTYPLPPESETHIDPEQRRTIEKIASAVQLTPGTLQSVAMMTDDVTAYTCFIAIMSWNKASMMYENFAEELLTHLIFALQNEEPFPTIRLSPSTLGSVILVHFIC